MFLWLADWWDSADLWLTQLAFPFQFAIVIAVLGPLCAGVAWAIDRCVDLVRKQPRAKRTQQLILVRADVPAGTPATIIRPEPVVTEPAVIEPAESPVTPAVGRRTPESTGS